MSIYTEPDHEPKPTKPETRRFEYAQHPYLDGCPHCGYHTEWAVCVAIVGVHEECECLNCKGHFLRKICTS